MQRNFEVTKAAVSDASAVVHLIALADEEAVIALSGKPSLCEAKAHFEQNFARSDVYFNFENVLTARKGAEVIGCILFFNGPDESRYSPIGGLEENEPRESSEDEVYIDSLAVDPGHRGEGIAGELVRRVIIEAKARGFAKVGLLADASNSRLGQMYRSLGFVQEKLVHCRGGEYEKLTHLVGG
ncbi:GNAT family N-acetyltransferase [Stenotrophomonas maltophilia]|nr:GNAT family N-acetyltransferase [Stenotrophomonas maltophilia]